MTHNGLRSSRNSSKNSQSETVSTSENLVEYVRDVHGNVTVCGGEGSDEMERKPTNNGKIEHKPIRGILKRTKSANAKLVNGFPQVHEEVDEFSSIDSSLSPNEDRSKYDLSVGPERKLADGETHVTNIPSDKSSTNVETDGTEKKEEIKDDSVSDVDQCSNVEISDTTPNMELKHDESDIVDKVTSSSVPVASSDETELVVQEKPSMKKSNGEESTTEVKENGDASSAVGIKPESQQPPEPQPLSSQDKQTEKPPNKSLLSLGSTQNSSYKTPSVSFDTSIDRTPSVSRDSSFEKTLSVSEPASASEKSSPMSRENSTDRTPTLSRASSVGSSETLKKWRRTGMAVKTSLKFQEAGRIAKLKQAMSKLKKESLRYMYV